MLLIIEDKKYTRHFRLKVSKEETVLHCNKNQWTILYQIKTISELQVTVTFQVIHHHIMILYWIIQLHKEINKNQMFS